MKSPLKFGSAYVMQDLHWFTSFFNKILTINKMSSKWLRSTLISIYKNKRDIQNCINYHEIKLMSHAMKLWERVSEHRLRHETTISNNQFGFMQG